jgi:putative oxidoreductase
MSLQNIWVVAAVLDFGAALLHLAIIAGGPSWYRFFGAGEGMARMAERRHLWPTVVTLAIAAALSMFGAYAMTAGGHFPTLPLPQEALMAITAIYAVRALVPLLLCPVIASMRTRFMIVSSLICGVYALAHGMALAT